VNEELETSKEELRPTNEELTTTIEELRNRIVELAAINAELDRTRIASEKARSYADIIIETIREPLAVLDGGLRILRVNSAFSQNLEIAREDAEGRLLHEIDGGRWNIPALRQRLGAVLSRAQPLEDWEVALDFDRQGRRVLSLSARMIPGDSDRTDLMLLEFVDATAHANVTAGLLADGERKDQFIALLGHELRHPLTAITHANYLLKRSNPDPTAAKLLETIDTQTQILLRFVNELLDVERIGRGLVEIQREHLDLVAVARHAIDTLKPRIEERGHALSVVLPAAPVHVRGDSGRLSQVIANLAENAMKFTEPGGQIAITLEQRGDVAVLRVRDSGIGMAAEDLKRVFEPFTKARNPLASASSGLGLGLSLVRQILLLHRGGITATSDGLAMGSEFVVTLPALAADTVADSSSERPTGPPSPPATLRTRRVLIVDDHEEVGKSVARIVRAWGHEVALVRDGPSALSIAERFQPERAIVDLSLPGMSGIELARRLREVFPPRQLYMIALTGYAGADISAACLAAGFDVHLVKPGQMALLETLLGAERPDSETDSR